MTSRNQTLFEESQKYIPGGVNSPVRAFRAVGGTPPFVKRGQGAHMWDEDDRMYIDYVLSWGPLIAGHAHPDVVRAVQAAAADGLSFGAPTARELELARRLCELLPGMDQVRLTSSGTEATMSAIRLARGYTGRPLIVKFEGSYHGHGDSLLVKAGSGALTFGNPSSAGVPAEVAGQTLTLEYNNIDQARAAFAAHGVRIAGVIVEPVAGNMNLVAPDPGFLEGLRELGTQYGSVLIFDEVMTGFRVGLSCAQGRFGITPDLTTLGKVIGGGMPLAAFGGKREMMQHLAPVGPVYQAGTLSGNPVAVAAGLATLDLVQAPGFYERLSQTAQALTQGLSERARRYNVPFSAQAVGGMLGLYFRTTPPRTYNEVMQADREAFNRFFKSMLEAGIYLAPSAYEAGFVSSAHTVEDINATLEAADKAFAATRS